MRERKPMMDDYDIKEFAIVTAGSGAAVGALMWLAALLPLPWPVVLALVIVMPTVAGLLMVRWVDRWWYRHSVGEGEVSDAKTDQ
jgi:hypothetical protein